MFNDIIKLDEYCIFNFDDDKEPDWEECSEYERAGYSIKVCSFLDNGMKCLKI